ncbi:MAG: hypothetical protein U1E26_06275 [Coriobacteriia bacterium]|nr:hypothetical protein [Coriobacteriia bacterium]
MSVCPKGASCAFFTTIEPSLVKRVKYASAYPYCKGGRHAECSLWALMAEGRSVPMDLLPDGSISDYRASGLHGAQPRGDVGERFLVVDDSPVFATLAANSLRQSYPGASVVECHSFIEAEPLLKQGGLRLVVSGNGLGDGYSALDVRRNTSAPIVLFTSDVPSEADTPANSQVVLRAAGPAMLRQATDALLGL